MEAADVFVVNKADRPGADKLRRELETALDLRLGRAFRNVPAHHGALRSGPPAPKAAPEPERWRPPVLATVAISGDGIDALMDALERQWQWMSACGELVRRRRKRLAQRTREVVDRAMTRWVWEETRADDTIAARLDDVAAGAISPYDLATEIVATLKEGARV